MTHRHSSRTGEPQSDESTVDFSTNIDPSAEEAVAMTIAITRFQAAQTAAKHEEDEWNPDRWTLHGRFANIGTPVDRFPRELPQDPWRSHGRSGLY